MSCALQEQRYEGGSTVYGPYTLDAHIQEFSRIAMDLAMVCVCVCVCVCECIQC